ncbi:MAG: FAD-dependent oxidoreductase, partial [Anaerolineae bacterium]|nr:FAD-dependent oxidoreductase [Anaerolineae bacterium]
MRAKRKPTIVVVGNGMVGHKFIELMVKQGATETYEIITFCEESRLAYDRVNLSSYFSGNSAAALSLVQPNFYDENGIHVYIGDRVAHIDRTAKIVTSANGVQIAYDKLVLATGSYPFVPPIKGNDAPGTFVYRTLDDLDAIQAYAAHVQIGVVVGGGLLGLECANALKNLGLTTHVVEFAPRLMPMQLDTVGGMVLRQKIEALGVAVHTSKSTTEIVTDEHGRVEKMRFADGSELQTDLIVFSAGIRPRDELARQCQLALGERGGIVIDDRCCTSDPDIFAIGECAVYENRVFGLVAPGYQMAGVVADQFCEPQTTHRFTGA